MRKELIGWLRERGAADFTHTGVPFLDHLTATGEILFKWTGDEMLRRVGYAHSLYAENSGRCILDRDDRSPLQTLIGSEAERLVFLNCVLLRNAYDGPLLNGVGRDHVVNRFDGERLALAPDEFIQLGTIQLADWVEQLPRQGDPAYRPKAFSTIARELGQTPMRDYIEAVRSAEARSL